MREKEREREKQAAAADGQTVLMAIQSNIWNKLSRLLLAGCHYHIIMLKANRFLFLHLILLCELLINIATKWLNATHFRFA